MDLSSVRARLDDLQTQSLSEANSPAVVATLYQGVLSVMRILYGSGSSNEHQLAESIAAHQHNRPDLVSMKSVLRGAITNMLGEVDAGFVGNLQARIAGDVLHDLVKLAKEVLGETGDGAKNVGCVLAAAAFEDTLRRLSAVKGLPHLGKLADVVTALKDAGALQGAQVGIAQSYLKFRNSALHAKWAEVDRPEAQGVLGFTEGLLVRHLS